MPAPRRVALVSDDLMFRSQLEVVIRASGGQLEAVGPLDAAGKVAGADAVFVDLNRETPVRLGLIAELHELLPELPIVGFCHHGDDETRRTAMRVGATSCVTNGGLQAAAQRLAGVPLSPGGHA